MVMKILSHIALAILGTLLVSCEKEEKFLTNGSLGEYRVLIMKGGKAVNPGNRDLSFVRLLTDSEKELLGSFVQAAKIKKRGYVISEYYLLLEHENEKRVFGVVYRPDQKSLWIDITSSNVSEVPVTTTHRILYVDDKDIQEKMVKIFFEKGSVP